jgi:hypothetical protein
MGAKTHTWGTLTRQDLRGFDEDQTKAILYAMDNGGVARLSSNGHCIIRNDQGQTMSVSRSAGGRRKQNVAADLCRLFGAPTTDPPPRAQAQANGHSDPSRVTTQGMEADEVLACPAKGCEVTFVTEGARYTHVTTHHWQCPQEGCGFVGRNAQSANLHHIRVHRGINPAKGRTKKPADAERAREPAPTPALVTTMLRREAEASVALDGETQPVSTGPDPHRPEAVLARVREALGEDPRVPQLRAEVDRLTRERDDALAQLSLVREALHLDRTG